ncbi:MAG: rod shape-determining protein MreD [Bacteroidota bacterium]
MNNEVIKNILRFILLVVIQVMVLNRINLIGFLNPYVYVLFVLLLPFETPAWLLLFAGFGMGLSIDAFTNSWGLHTAATTFMAFSRPGVLGLITSKKEYEPGLRPGIRDLGINWFLSYTFSLVFLHHFALFFLESFRFSEFFPTLLRVILNTLLTMGLLVLSQYLFTRKKK